MAGSSVPFKAVVAYQSASLHFGSLKYCQKQSEQIAAAFEACPDADVRCVPQATGEHLLSAIKAAAADCSERDIIVVFLAGHGARTASGQWRFVVEETAADNVESTGVSLDSLLSAVRDTRALGVVFLLDTCFSGKVTVQPAAWEQVKTPVLSLIAASCADSESWEIPSLEGTAFGQALTECLKQGFGPSPDDQEITLSRLAEFLGRRANALSKVSAIETNVQVLVIRAPATTTICLTPRAPSDIERRRIVYTLRDVAVYVRRAVGVVLGLALSLTALLAVYARMHESARINGELAEVRSGMEGLSWFQGPIQRSYAGIRSPSDSANWFLRDSIGSEIPQNFHIEAPLNWLAGRSSAWPQSSPDVIHTAVSNTSGVPPETALLFAELNADALERLLQFGDPNWSSTELEALSLQSKDRYEAVVQQEVARETDWMQSVDAFAPPCSSTLDTFLHERKNAAPYQAGIADFGAYLAGCPRNVADLLTPLTPRVDTTARLLRLFGSRTSDLNDFRLVLSEGIDANSPRDSALDVIAFERLSGSCDALSVTTAKRFLATKDIFVGLLPILLSCPSSTFDVRDNTLIVSIPAVSRDSLTFTPEMADYFQYSHWSRAAYSLFTTKADVSDRAKAWASKLLVETSNHDEPIGSLAIWPVLDAKLPYARLAPAVPGKPIRGEEQAYWFACAPSVATTSPKTEQFDDKTALAIATVACRNIALGDDVAAQNAWNLGFVKAGLGSSADALAHLSSVSPAERAGAAQGIVTRSDAALLLPSIAQLQNDRFPNPEAALVAPLIRWRARFLESMSRGGSEKCREIAAAFGGTRGWDARSYVGLAHPGMRAWLLAATLGKGPCAGAPESNSRPTITGAMHGDDQPWARLATFVIAATSPTVGQARSYWEPLLGYSAAVSAVGNSR